MSMKRFCFGGRSSRARGSGRELGWRVRAATRLVLFVGTVAVVTLVAPSGAQTQPELRMVELGRLLFWDPVLSGEQDVSCAKCHHPDFAYADGRALSLGAGAAGLGPNRVDASNGRIPIVRRNSMTVLNTGFNGLDRRRRRGSNTRRTFDGTVASVDQAAAPMFWDNRVRSLEAQALEPLKAMEEMRGTALPRPRRSTASWRGFGRSPNTSHCSRTSSARDRFRRISSRGHLPLSSVRLSR